MIRRRGAGGKEDKEGGSLLEKVYLIYT